MTLVQTPVTTTVNEGSLAMYSCSGAVSSLSLPAQYRPDPSNLVYTFSISNLGTLRRPLDGSVIGSYTGQVIDRFTLIDNQTLRINPIDASDNRQYVYCTVCDNYSCGSNDLYIHMINCKFSTQHTIMRTLIYSPNRRKQLYKIIIIINF